MTRVTNFGRKRTHLEATQDHAQTPSQVQECDGSKGTTSKPADPAKGAASQVATMEGYFGKAEDEPSSEPPKKRRKRGPKSKKNSDQKERSESDANETQEYPGVTSGAKYGRKLDRKKKAAVTASEARRMKRINHKLSETTCFACREKGHAAKDCLKAIDDGHRKSKVPIGICYRCGSKKHSLSRCKKPNDPGDPFPFAFCFVCNGEGHLASGCPQNKGKGIYPNGGCCKLCGETNHLARNCTMRQTANDPTAFVGTAHEAGADEDDFHTFKRTTMELDRTEKREGRIRKMLEVKKAVVSGVAVRLDSDNLPLQSAKKKVVVFK